MGPMLIAIIIALVVALLFASVKLIPQGEAAVIERLGRYTRTVSGGVDAARSVYRSCSCSGRHS